MVSKMMSMVSKNDVNGVKKETIDVNFFDINGVNAVNFLTPFDTIFDIWHQFWCQMVSMVSKNDVKWCQWCQKMMSNGVNGVKKMVS